MTALQAIASGVVVLTCLLGVPLLLGLAGLAWTRHRTPGTEIRTFEASAYAHPVDDWDDRDDIDQWETELDPPFDHQQDAPEYRDGAA